MLTIKIYSFSFLKNGLPEDNSGNGGGFVFDCRALPNPGRIEAYKSLTGLDTPVIDYLDKEQAVSQFINNVFAVVAQSIDNYLERGFENLSVSFGCTGGQHRSVYCAEQCKQKIMENYDNVNIEICHYQKEIGY